MSNTRATLMAAKILLVIAFIFSAYRITFIAMSETALGHITHFEEQQPNEGDDDKVATFLPHFSFTTDTGRIIETSANVASFPQKLAVGEEVNIRYLPFYPNWAIIDRAIYRWFITGLLVGMGFIFYMISLVFKVLNK